MTWRTPVFIFPGRKSPTDINQWMEMHFLRTKCQINFYQFSLYHLFAVVWEDGTLLPLEDSLAFCLGWKSVIIHTIQMFLANSH